MKMGMRGMQAHKGVGGAVPEHESKIHKVVSD